MIVNVIIHCIYSVNMQIGPDNSKKRLGQSVERTISWYKDMCSSTDSGAASQWRYDGTVLIGVVLPYHIFQTATNSNVDVDMAFIMTDEIMRGHIHTMLSTGSGGICVGGAGMGETMSSRGMAIARVKEVVRTVSLELRRPAETLLMIQGMDTLTEVRMYQYYITVL